MTRTRTALSAFTETMVERRGLPAQAALDAFRAAGYTGRHMLGIILAVAALLLAAPALALEPREGWRVHPTEKAYDTLLSDLKAAVRAEGMGLVTEAGPTGAAAARGIEIPGNRVVGVFRNDFAVRILRLSPAAMIEAPVRFYVTEEPDGTATLSYKTPGFVFAPYMAEGGADLDAAAAELDAIFAAIADRARGQAD